MTTVLVVSADPNRGPALAQALKNFEVLSALDAAAALERLGRGSIDLVLADYRLGASTGLELFAQCAARFLDVRKVLASEYEDLPEIVAARAQGLLSRVVPLDGPAENLSAVLTEVIAGARETTASSARATFKVADVGPLLEWTAVRAARVRNVVVREPPAGATEQQLQFVMPRRTSLEAFRQDLVSQWHLPLKPRDAAVTRGQRDHPVLSWLGALSDEAEIFCRRVEDSSTCAYLALLPWKKEPKVTCVLGVHSDDAWREALLSAHAAALKQVATFPMPTVASDEESSGIGQIVPEYDWVVTRSYAGKDRRQEPTAFLGRHAFVGQRQRVPSRIAGGLGTFADRLSPALRRLFALYVALALLDAVLTWWLVRAGRVVELNPAMGALLSAGPWWFFAAKNGVALAAFALIARFEHARVGVWVARAVVLLFGAVDGWWLWVFRFSP